MTTVAERGKGAKVCGPLCYIAAAMKSRTEYLTLNVPARRGFVNITGEVVLIKVIGE